MTTTQLTRFNEKRGELREIAFELGRVDIFDRDAAVSAADAIEGVGWYLQEEFEHIEDEYARDAAYTSSPLVKRYREIVRYIEARA